MPILTWRYSSWRRCPRSITLIKLDRECLHSCLRLISAGSLSKKSPPRLHQKVWQVKILIDIFPYFKMVSNILFLRWSARLLTEPLRHAWILYGLGSVVFSGDFGRRGLYNWHLFAPLSPACDPTKSAQWFIGKNFTSPVAIPTATHVQQPYRYALRIPYNNTPRQTIFWGWHFFGCFKIKAVTRWNFKPGTSVVRQLWSVKINNLRVIKISIRLNIRLSGHCCLGESLCCSATREI